MSILAPFAISDLTGNAFRNSQLRASGGMSHFNKKGSGWVIDNSSPDFSGRQCWTDYFKKWGSDLYKIRRGARV